jgi:hypothetical protein
VFALHFAQERKDPAASPAMPGEFARQSDDGVTRGEQASDDAVIPTKFLRA